MTFWIVVWIHRPSSSDKPRRSGVDATPRLVVLALANAPNVFLLLLRLSVESLNGDDGNEDDDDGDDDCEDGVVVTCQCICLGRCCDTKPCPVSIEHNRSKKAVACP